MISSEKGFALVSVLIFMALGTLMVVPALKLANSTLGLKQLRTLTLQDQYARDGGAEHAMWKLQYGGGTGELTQASQTIEYTIVLNGISTDVVIQLRAEPGLSGQGLANAGFKILPDSTVSPMNPSPGVPATFDYEITLQQLDPDATGTIDEIWNQLPPGFTYVDDSSASPDFTVGNPVSPADYDPVNDVQTIHWLFSPPINLVEYGQIKRMTFQADAIPQNNTRYCNEVALKPNAERAGKSSIIELGTPPQLGCDGMQVPVTLGASPGIVPPNLSTTVTFTATYTNMDIGAHELDEITVVLAPGFTYDAGSAAEFGSNMTTDEPTVVLVDGRHELKWDTFPAKPVPFAVDQVRTQAFKATTTPTESGSAYAEVFTKIVGPCDYAPCILGLETGYSWQVGVTIVPAYDVRSEAEITSGWGNAIPGGGVSLESWNVTSP